MALLCLIAMSDYHDADGEATTKEHLRIGDRVALRVSWFGDFEEAIARPTFFTVVEAPNHIADRKLEGDDGETYRIFDSRATVECTTDDKEGYHRGNLCGRIKKLN